MTGRRSRMLSKMVATMVFVKKVGNLTTKNTDMTTCIEVDLLCNFSVMLSRAASSASGWNSTIS